MYDESTARDVVLEAGQLSLHDVHLIHGSRPNRSPRHRAGLAIRNMPATSHFDRTILPMTSYGMAAIDFSRCSLWLVRGPDRAGNDFAVGTAADESARRGRTAPEGPRRCPLSGAHGTVVA